MRYQSLNWPRIWSILNPNNHMIALPSIQRPRENFSLLLSQIFCKYFIVYFTGVMLIQHNISLQLLPKIFVMKMLNNSENDVDWHSLRSYAVICQLCSKHVSLYVWLKANEIIHKWMERNKQFISYSKTAFKPNPE